MRFSDIKKFWEVRLGGQPSKSSQAADGSVDKNCRRSSFSPKKSVVPNGKGSIKNRSAKYYVNSSQRSTCASAQLHTSIDIAIKKGIEDSDVVAPLKNGVEAEGNSKAIDAIAAIDNNRKDKREKKRTSFAFNAQWNSGKAADEHAETSKYDIVAEKFVISDQSVPSSTESSPKKVWSFKKKRFVLDLVNSDNHLNKTPSKADRTNGLDSISAPPSVQSSPCKSMKASNNVRYYSRSNVKFNEVQNFWMMREKKLIRRSVDERRCLVCGCYLNNYFYEHDNALYCEEDYWSKFGHCCRKCNGIITGPIIIAGFHRFHPECFSCQCCKRCISDGDLYSLLLFEQSDYEPPTQSMLLFCHSCYEGRLAEYAVDSDAENNSSKCSVIQVLHFVPNQSTAIVHEQGVEDSKLACSEGYGLSVKNVPLNVATETNSQLIGQLVCGINAKESCSLQVGDVLLQVNGLAVDLNALDLIDRLFDDSGAPLQLTIQRDIVVSTKMLFGDSGCTHPDKMTMLTNSFDRDLSLVLNSDNSTKPVGKPFVAEDVIVDSQPSSPAGAISDQSDLPSLDSDVEVQVSATAKDADGNSDFCSPFSSLSSSPLCCDHEVQLKPTANGVSENTDDVFHDKPIASFDTNQKDSHSPSEKSQAEPHHEETETQNSNSSSSAIDSASSDVESVQNSDLSIVVSNSQTSSLDGAKTSLNIHNDDSKTTDEPVILSNEKNENETNGQVATPAESKPLSILPPPSAPDDLNSEFLPSSISPRSKRLALKRKSLTVTEQNGKGPLLSAKQEIGKKESAKRCNSLRHNAPVTMRRFSPRGRLNSPRILSVYSSEQVDTMGGDLSRSESMRVHGLQMGTCPRVFRPCDLIHGEVLGQGFFGKAIKVTHRDTGEVMVLKVLNSLDDDVEKSFLKEVKVMRNLVHRNVIHFIGVLYKDRRLNIITEFVENGTLKDVINNMDMALPWAQRVHIAHDISSGMSYLHSKNLIHRDLNSGNCFVKKNGVVVVADFGLARVHSKAASLGRRKRYTVVGNPYWMAPEMIYGQNYDERVDIFSFGIVLCEIIGRVDADPDYLPRSDDFGLAVKVFHDKFCDHCPAFFFAIAVNACSLDPDNRPSFKVLEEWFQMLNLREELTQLPEPPHLHQCIISAYEKYNLPLPSNLYAPFIESENGLSETNIIPSRHNSSSLTLDLECSSDSNVDLVPPTFSSRDKNCHIPGTEFYSDYSVTSRL